MRMGILLSRFKTSFARLKIDTMVVDGVKPVILTFFIWISFISIIVLDYPTGNETILSEESSCYRQFV